MKVDELGGALRGGRRFRAFETSAAVLGFGALIWGGFFIYDLFSNTLRGMEESFNELTENPFARVDTVVNPAVLTSEGINIAVRAYKPGPVGLSRAGYEAALQEIAKKVDEAGVGTLTNAQIALVKRAEKSAVAQADGTRRRFQIFMWSRGG